jgi:hypothetical protein
MNGSVSVCEVRDVMQNNQRSIPPKNSQALVIPPQSSTHSLLRPLYVPGRISHSNGLLAYKNPRLVEFLTGLHISEAGKWRFFSVNDASETRQVPHLPPVTSGIGACRTGISSHSSDRRVRLRTPCVLNEVSLSGDSGERGSSVRE